MGPTALLAYHARCRFVRAMGSYTRYTRRWLDRRYETRTGGGVYFAHEPVYGLNHPASEPGHPLKLARLFQILSALNRLRFDTLLDVGAGEGALAHLVERLFGARAAATDLSLQAARRAFDLFGLESAAVDSGRLPFRDSSFDVVVSSETIEHVEYPVETLLELERVAGRALVLTTEEVELDRQAIQWMLDRRCGAPHLERNYFHPEDLELVFGAGVEMRPQFAGELIDRAASVEECRGWILGVTAGEAVDGTGDGVLLLKAKSADALGAARYRPDELLDGMFRELALPAERLSVRAREGFGELLLERVRCPRCHSGLAAAGGEELACAGCGTRFPAPGLVPDLADLAAGDPEPTRLESELERVFPGDAERRELLRGLRDRLLLAVQGDKSGWDFTRPDERVGWMPSPGLVHREDDGSFRFRSTDDDPWITGPALLLLADELLGVELTYRVWNPDFGRDAAVGQVYWMREEDFDLAEERSVVFPVINDGASHTYRIPLADEAAWPRSGRILLLRIDPANGPGEIDLEACRLITRARGARVETRGEAGEER